MGEPVPPNTPLRNFSCLCDLLASFFCRIPALVKLVRHHLLRTNDWCSFLTIVEEWRKDGNTVLERDSLFRRFDTQSFSRNNKFQKYTSQFYRRFPGHVGLDDSSFRLLPLFFDSQFLFAIIAADFDQVTNPDRLLVDGSISMYILSSAFLIDLLIPL